MTSKTVNFRYALQIN